jgi:hypothetical protein
MRQEIEQSTRGVDPPPAEMNPARAHVSLHDEKGSASTQLSSLKSVPLISVAELLQGTRRSV